MLRENGWFCISDGSHVLCMLGLWLCARSAVSFQPQQFSASKSQKKKKKSYCRLQGCCPQIPSCPPADALRQISSGLPSFPGLLITPCLQRGGGGGGGGLEMGILSGRVGGTSVQALETLINCSQFLCPKKNHEYIFCCCCCCCLHVVVALALGTVNLDARS